MGVDGDAVAVGVDADRVEADPLYTGAPARGHEQVVAAQLSTVLQCQDVIFAVAPGRRCLDTQHKFDAVAPKHFAQRLAQRRRLASEHTLRSLDQGHLAAQASHGLCHLRANWSAAQYQEATWHGLHAGHFAVGPDTLQVGHARHRWHDRIRAGRHHNVPSGMGHTVNFDHAHPGQPASTAAEGRCPCRPANVPGPRPSSSRP